MALGTGFSGHLSIVSLREVLHKLHVAGETGRLCLFTPMALATVWLRSGDVVDAAIGERTGEGALDVLSILSDGTFTFFAEATGRDGALLQAAAIQANWQAKAPKVTSLINDLPSLIDALDWDASALATVSADKPQHKRLLEALGTNGTLLEALIAVDVELVEALEALLQAVQAQAKTRSVAEAKVGLSKAETDRRSDSAALEPKLPFGSQTLVGGAGLQASEPPFASGAIVGVRPRRTVLGGDKRSSAMSASHPQPRLDPIAEPAPKASNENMMARTLVGVPMPDLTKSPDVNPARLDVNTEPKARARRFSQRTSEPAAAAAGDLALEVGDVLDLVPETIRRPEPAGRYEPDRKSDSDHPPPSSLEGGSIVLGGRRLARVSLLSEVGRFAVQLVADSSKSDGSEMALKLPRRQDEVAYAALRAEGSILGAVSHPNLVRLAQAGSDGDMPFLLTWYWPGLTLAELAAFNKPLPIGLVVCVVRQVLDALSALHDPTNPRGGFVHCNLCPENVLIGFDGVVRVCGLSNARRVKSKVNDEDLGVHAQYAAPELLRGQRVDERSDVFSAGMLLALAFKGVTGPDSAELAQVRGVWNRATDSASAQRYANARDFGVALDKSTNTWGPREVADWLAKELAQLKLEAARAAAAAQEPSGPSRRRWLFVAIGAVVLLAIVALVLALKFKR